MLAAGIRQRFHRTEPQTPDGTLRRLQLRCTLGVDRVGGEDHDVQAKRQRGVCALDGVSLRELRCNFQNKYGVRGFTRGRHRGKHI
jgi:hypothetical protein